MDEIIKKNTIILLVAILSVILIIVVGLISNSNIKKTEKKLTSNTNENVINDAEVDGIKLNNITLLMEGNSSTFSCNITNTTDNDISDKLIIIFKSNSGQEVASIEGYYGDTLKAGETKKISAGINKILNENIVKSVEYKLE